MKNIIYLLFLLTLCSNKDTVIIDDLNKAYKEDKNLVFSISIEWIGNVDKPIPKIIMCANCKDKKDLLKTHLYKINSTSFEKIRKVYFKKSDEIKIDEKNKKDYIVTINKIILLLIEKKENPLLVDDLKLFIKRIDY
jgi:hypothetical protein